MFEKIFHTKTQKRGTVLKNNTKEESKTGFADIYFRKRYRYISKSRAERERAPRSGIAYRLSFVE